MRKGSSCDRRNSSYNDMDAITSTRVGVNPSAEEVRSSSNTSSQQSARGYHLFQSGPIRLLSGALEAEVLRGPGGKQSRRPLTMSSMVSKNDANSARISMAPSSLLASRTTDYHKWVLALRPPPEEDDWVENDAALSARKKSGPPDIVLRSECNEPGSPSSKSSPKSDLDIPLEDQITVRHLRLIMRAFATHPVDFFAKSTYSLTDSEEGDDDEKWRVAMHSSSRASVDHPLSYASPSATLDIKNYDRKLSTDDFVAAVKEIMPTASQESILELANKVDYEGVGVITWNELSTYLVSQSNHRTLLSHVSAEFSQVPDPSSCSMERMHQLVSCFCICSSKKLIVTGGQEGTVRAWTVSTLSYRGILFSTDSWITGVQFSANARILFVVTMDKEIFTLDGENFEVLRVYRGRPVDDNPNSLVYVHDTTRTVTVGGIPLLSRKALERQLESATKMNEKRKQEFNTQTGAATITSASACEALNFDSLPITGEGNGPYVERSLEECVLAGLVDPVTCLGYNFSLLEEEVILLGTNCGEIYFYNIHPRSNKKVVLSHHILRFHSQAVNKLAFMYSMNALVSCADDGKVLVTSMVNGQIIRTFQATPTAHFGHVAVRDFAIHPHYKMVVTVGPERYGLVWEFSQESPIAVLDFHNCPCRCCAFSQKNAQVITCGVDGILHIFDLNGFHLSQKLEPGYAHLPQHILCDSTGSLLCFRRYPFHLRMKRMKASETKEKYIGHTAASVSILYSKAFDQIITVDVEFTTMTWGRSTGKNLFTFLLNGYSDSTTTNASPLTCASLDVAQRRLIVGYQNGVVVVWNVVNGQAINFITAGTEEAEESRLHLSHRERRRSESSSFPGVEKKSGLPSISARSGGATTMNTSHAYRPVLTVGSLLRDGSTFFVFAIQDTLYMVRESTNYTVATAASWKVPTDYGEITGIMQVTTEVIVCGTSLGAVFFFHLLSQRQDGAVRWIPESHIHPILPTEGKGFLSKRHGATTSPPSSMGLSQFQAGGGNSLSALQTSKLGKSMHSGVAQIFPLFAMSPNLFLTAHADGTIAFWHTVRRVYLGSVNLTSATADDGKDRSGSLVVAVDDVHHLLVFGDDGGNIHVCRFHMALLSPEQEVAALALGNPALFFPMTREEIVPATRRVSSGEFAEVNQSSSVSNTTETSPIPTTEQSISRENLNVVAPSISVAATTNRYFMERAIYLPDQFERVHVFGTSTRSLSSVVIAVSPWKRSTHQSTTRRSRSNDPQHRSNLAEESDATKKKDLEDSNAEKEEDNVIIICSGSDSYIRCFTLKGEPIGELGMDSWVLEDKRSYRYLGHPYEGGHFDPSFTLEKGWHYNYLKKLLEASKSSFGTKKTRSKVLHSMSNYSLEINGKAAASVKLFPMKEEGTVGPEGGPIPSSAHHAVDADAASMPTDPETEKQEKAFCPSDSGRGKPFSSSSLRHQQHVGKPIDTKIIRSLRHGFTGRNVMGNRILKRQCFQGTPPSLEVPDSLSGVEGGSIVKKKGVLLTPVTEGMPTEMDSTFATYALNSKIPFLKLGQLSPAPLSPSERLFSSVQYDDMSHNRQSLGFSLQSIVKVLHRSPSIPSPASPVSEDLTSPKSPRFDATAKSSVRTTPPLQSVQTTAFSTDEKESETPSSRLATIGHVPEPCLFRNDFSALPLFAKSPSPPLHRLPSHSSVFVSKRTSSPLHSGSGTRFMGRTPSCVESVAGLNTSSVPNAKDRASTPRQQSRFLLFSSGRPITPPKEMPSRPVEEEIQLSPNDLIKQHLSDKRKKILESACSDKSRRRIEHEMSRGADGTVRRGTEEVEKLSDIHQFVQNVVDQHRKAKSSAALSGALNYITGISSRMHVVPVQDIEPPEGSKSKAEVHAWRDHLSRLKKNAAI